MAVFNARFLHHSLGLYLRTWRSDSRLPASLAPTTRVSRLVSCLKQANECPSPGLERETVRSETQHTVGGEWAQVRTVPANEGDVQD